MNARIVRLRSTTSTMTDAAALAKGGEAHGTAVVAEEQTRGVGRHGNTWHSDSGGGLYFSVILRLGLAPELTPVLTMALGLAVQRAVNDLCDVAADLRWPNDVMLNDKKLAGTLVQASEDALIAGIGVNVNQRSLPQELGGIATSLLIETGREWPKEELFDKARAEIQRYSAMLAEAGKAEIFRRFERQSSYVRGKNVVVDMPGREIRGTTVGLDENGFLKVATPSRIETIIAGGVRPAN